MPEWPPRGSEEMRQHLDDEYDALRARGIPHEKAMQRLAGDVDELASMRARPADAVAADARSGVLSYLVGRRTQEIGIRLVLGATRADVLRLVVIQGMTLAVGGIAIGIAAAWGLTQLLRGLLFGVSPHDPATFAAIAALLASVAFVASYLPARRATHVDPVCTLRSE
jgi:putative ABC transport system permease protein